MALTKLRREKRRTVRQELREIGQQVRERAFDGFTPVAPIRRAISSGHGIGKSALTVWIVLWLMSTRPDSRGTVTANTYVQLETKTWAAIQKWHKLCLTASWFICTSKRLYHRNNKDTWFCSPATCKEENSEAFAGQHAADASSFYVFDERHSRSDRCVVVRKGYQPRRLWLRGGKEHVHLLGTVEAGRPVARTA